MAKIVITGSCGKIGSVLAAGLSSHHEVVGLDLPDGDISNYGYLLDQMRNVDMVIHVAWSGGTDRENPRTGALDPANILLEMNVFHAAAEARVKRLIMASSVHADNFIGTDPNDLLTVPGSRRPITPYGAHKVITEEIGRFYSTQYGIEFIGIRFGGVTKDNSVKDFGKEPAVWLSHRDLLGAVEACVTAPLVPDSFVVFYAVSNNAERLHSSENPFGWEPLDSSADYQ